MRGPHTFRKFMRYLRQNTEEGDSGSELRIRTFVPGLSSLYPVGDPAPVLLRPTFGSVAVDLTSRLNGTLE